MHQLLNAVEGIITHLINPHCRLARKKNPIGEGLQPRKKWRRLVFLNWDSCQWDTCCEERRRTSAGHALEDDDSTNNIMLRKAEALCDIAKLLLRGKMRLCSGHVEEKRWALGHCRVTLRQLFICMAKGDAFYTDCEAHVRRLLSYPCYKCLVGLGPPVDDSSRPSLVPLALHVRLLVLSGRGEEFSRAWMLALRSILRALEEDNAADVNQRIIVRVFNMLVKLGVLSTDSESGEEEADEDENAEEQ